MLISPYYRPFDVHVPPELWHRLRALPAATSLQIRDQLRPIGDLAAADVAHARADFCGELQLEVEGFQVAYALDTERGTVTLVAIT